MISFFLIIVLSVVMFHTGLMIFVGYSTVHREKIDQYNWSDMVVISALEPKDMEKIEEIISASDYIESYEKLKPVNMEFVIESLASENGDSKNAYDFSSSNLYTLPYGEWGEIEAPHFVELSDEEYDNPIYISVYSNTNFFKAKLGDSIDVKVKDKYYTFQVAGIYENMFANVMGVTYVDPSLYDEWKLEKQKSFEEAQKNNEEVRQYEMTIFNMKLVPGTDDVEGAGRLSKSFDEHGILAYAQGSSEIITALSFMQNMIAAMLMAFAVIIAIISMIIIYFRITNSIEQNITNIGALKALGYTSKQIRKSMILEFLLTSAVAFGIGIGCSYLIIPSFETMMRSNSGVVWDHPFDPISFIVTAVIILGTVYIVSKISTKNIAKLDPVIALRFGINDHSFKKNRAPIEKTPGPLTWVMALKSLIGNTKQNVILTVVTVSIGLVTTFAAFLAYNCVYDPMHLYRMLKFESGDVEFYMNSDDLEAFTDIQNLPEVDKVWWTDSVSLNVDGYAVDALITDDWTDVPDVNILSGRIPKYDNEITIGGYMSTLLGKGIGDEVTVANGLIERRYLITGIDQNSNNMGKDIVMTSEGARHLEIIPQRTSFSVNVKDHSLVNSQKVVTDFIDMHGNKVNSYLNIIEALKSGNEQTIIIAGAMVLLMVLISVAVIVLSMNLLVKTVIIKKQKEIGIKKALGFSSNQLRLELILSMLPQITIGASIGAVLGISSSNKMLAAMLSAVGITRSNMDVFPWMGIVAVIFAAAVSFGIIWIISKRIKRISAYSLITE